MTDTPMDERRFTDREVRDILKKAVERAPSRALAKTEGLSLAELKTIGEEVGIAPDRLEDAARAVVRTGGNRPNRVLGGPLVINFEQKARGKLAPDDTPEVISRIRRTMGQQGEVTEIQGSLEWSAKGDSGERYVSLSPRGGTTTIRSSANLSNAAVLTYLPAGIMGLMATFVGLIKFAKSGSELALIVVFTVLPILYPILRTIFGWFSASEERKLRQVVDELTRLMEGEA